MKTILFGVPRPMFAVVQEGIQKETDVRRNPVFWLKVFLLV